MIDMAACLIAHVTNFFLIDIVKKYKPETPSVRICNLYKSATCH